MSIDEKIHYRGRFLGIMERNGWEFVYRTNATGVVVMVAVTDADELLLVEQYRVPVGGRVIELPAGLVGDAGDAAESAEAAAHRELLEETGYRAGTLSKLLACPSTPGMANEVITIYYAADLEREHDGGGDSSEDIVVHRIPLETAADWLAERAAAGVMLDPKIYAGLFWAQARR